MVRPDDVAQLDDVDAQVVGFGTGLDDPAEAPPLAALAAHPAGLDGLVAGGLDGPEGLAVGRETPVEIPGEGLVDGPAGDRVHDRFHQRPELLLVHLAPFRSWRRGRDQADPQAFL